MYNIIKTTVTISMIQKNTVHNVICTQQIKKKKRNHAGKTTFV